MPGATCIELRTSQAEGRGFETLLPLHSHETTMFWAQSPRYRPVPLVDERRDKEPTKMNTEWQPIDPDVVGADEPGSPLGESAEMAPTHRVKGPAGAGRGGSKVK